jgi:DNA-directed RNA polymerase subunit RPC12/RpoP
MSMDSDWDDRIEDPSGDCPKCGYWLKVENKGEDDLLYCPNCGFQDLAIGGVQPRGNHK